MQTHKALLEEPARTAGGNMARNKPDIIRRGDIAVWAGDSGNGDHVEIVTDVTYYEEEKFNDSFFCSIGAGRGDHTNGKIKCKVDGRIFTSDIKFLRFQI